MWLNIDNCTMINLNECLRIDYNAAACRLEFRFANKEDYRIPCQMEKAKNFFADLGQMLNYKCEDWGQPEIIRLDTGMLTGDYLHGVFNKEDTRYKPVELW